MQVKERNLNLDIIRIFACFGVVLLHVASDSVMSKPVGSAEWGIAHIYNSLGQAGTVCFLFISGCLLLSEDYHFSPKHFYTHNFLRLFAAYYIWIIIYHVVGFIQRGDRGWIYVKDAIINVIRGDAGYHFWYLPMLLGIYLLLPVLRAICKTKGIVVYCVGLFVIVQIVFTTIKYFEFPHKYLFVSLMDRIPFTLVNHYVGYFLMGYLLMLLIKEGFPHMGNGMVLVWCWEVLS